METTTTTTTASGAESSFPKEAPWTPPPEFSVSSFKRAKVEEFVSEKVIGTHSGTFQADEAMGVWMLRQVDEYRNARLVRSRDPAILDKQDIVIDVGGVYDHEKRRYDHHQRNYDDRFDGGDGEARCTKLSASGLVYRHYGKEVIRSHYPCLQDEVLDMVYVKLYNRLLEALDAIDTGVEMIPKTIRRRRRHPPLKNGEFATTKGSNNNNENDDDEYEEIEIMVEPLWRDSTGLSSRVSRLNPRWNEEDFHGDQPCPDDRFEMASRICGEEFLSHLTVIVESDLPARQFVEQGVLMRKGVDTSGEIVTLPNGGLPWKNHLYELEKKHAIDPLVKFVLYTDQGGMWRVQAVTVKGKNFENRLGLPEGWRGVRDTDLTRIAGIPGCRFCHAAGFIGGNDTYEGALAMARAALSRRNEIEV